MADRKKRFSPAVLAGDGALLLCAMAGLTGSFLSLYGDGTAPWSTASVLDRCAADTGPLLAWSALFALAALAAWSLPRFCGAAAGGLAALWMMFLWRNWAAVRSGAILTVKAIADQFAQRVDWGRTFDYTPLLSPARAAGSAQLFLTLALALLALALGWAVVRARRWWAAALLTLPPLLPGLLADLYPSWPPFMALCTCWCAMLLCDLCKWAAPPARGRLTLAALPAAALALAAVTLAFPREGYTRPAWALKAQEGLVNLTSRAADYFSHWDGPFQSTVTYVGAAAEADLAHAGPLRYTGRTVLRLASGYDGRLYLRGSSLAAYEDGVWKALPEGAYEEYVPDGPTTVPLYLPSPAGDGSPVYTATVDNVGAVGACVYAPYFLTPQDWEAAGMLPVEDAYFARKQGQWTHTMEFAELPEPRYTDAEDGTAMFTTGQAGGAAFGTYPGLVSQHYLDVPEELWESLAGPYWTKYHFVTADPLWAAENVAALLDELCEYDPETPAAPEGADPVEYFLTESRRGYCMHFASAATLMLRSLGIPARYVSGFTAQSVPGRQVDIPDRAAHAWVEVWLDGFGWYPVEVTPEAAFQWYEQGDALPSGQPTDTPPGETPPTPSPTPSQAPDSGPEPAATPQGGGDGPAPSGPRPSAPAWPAGGLAAAGISALLWLAQRLLKKHRAKKLAGPDRNRAALDGYGYLLRLERWGGLVDPRAVELAQKARFSQHTLTSGELDEVRGAFDRERGRLYAALSPVKRLVFRYFWGKPLTNSENHV